MDFYRAPDPPVGSGNACRNLRGPRTVAVLVTGPRRAWMRRYRPLPVAAVAAAKMHAGCLPREYLCSPGSRPRMVLVWPRMDCQIAPLAPLPPRAPFLDRSL